jgi:hypothetical protein
MWPHHHPLNNKTKTNKQIEQSNTKQTNKRKTNQSNKNKITNKHTKTKIGQAAPSNTWIYLGSKYFLVWKVRVHNVFTHSFFDMYFKYLKQQDLNNKSTFYESFILIFMYIHVITISEVVNMWCMPRKTLVSTSNPDTKVELSLKQTTKQKTVQN